MENNEQVYFKLQRHLDSQAVGFPATRSGSEMKILKHIFTPQEAKIATCLTYKFEPLEMVFERSGHLAESPEKLEELLGRIEKKGGIELKIKDGKRFYCNAPLVVGMYEFQVGKLTPEFIKNFDDYTSDKKFGVELISTKLPQMRTIPIAKSIKTQHKVSTFDEVTALLEQAEAPFAIFECICRQKKSITGNPCHVTDRKETCFAAGSMAQTVLRSSIGREITLDESMSILNKNQKQGLVLQPSNTEKAEFICSCCGCCCGMLGMHKNLPKPVDFWASNFYAVADANLCDGCGNCEKRCQVGAASVSEKKKQTSIDLNRCIGCGVCVPTCPQKAISLQKKPVEVRPPQNREELYDIIMSNKKGRLGKMKVTGKLFVDAIRTGQTHLLK
ncbi:4Fe-4S dicluster domain-containing protein [Desulfococcaceae bacterium HSG9]|nr:4Fe-4S dicluster domain-containing protein [Desulfococcaceae bacterium HSG9]